MEKNVVAYNSEAWDKMVEKNDQWTQPVTTEQVDAARNGAWEVVLTPVKKVPRDWFPQDMKGIDLLCLASGGGQQGPLFAAAGANVTVFDNSAAQLQQDRMVADRDGLEIKTVQGDMADLSMFQDASFDLIFHPCSNCYAPDIKPVWKECARIARKGASLLVGFTNPTFFLFEDPWEPTKKDKLLAINKLPFSELTDISEEKRQAYVKDSDPLMFGHTLDDQIGAQLAAGFMMTHLFEDEGPGTALEHLMKPYIATRAVRN